MATAVSSTDTVAPVEERAESTGALSRVQALGLQVPLIIGAAALMIVSIFLPYWNIVLRAPQYPKGLSVDVFVNRMEDERAVQEVDGLNHYIGMIKLTDAGTFERLISVYAIAFFAVLAIASLFMSGKWRTIARLPVIVYPIIFVVDLFAWLYYAGHTLDDSAALSSSIDEFTPKIVGEGTIGQFSTEAMFQAGFWLAGIAALLTLAAVILDRRRRHDVGTA